MEDRIYRPKRGKGRIKTKQEDAAEEPESFDWERQFSGQEKAIVPAKAVKVISNSTLDSFLVLVIVIRTPPGSGAGLIPLHLPRQEKRAKQELTQLNSLQRGAFVSKKKLLALSFYEIRISSDYRLFSNILIFSKKN